MQGFRLMRKSDWWIIVAVLDVFFFFPLIKEWLFMSLVWFGLNFLVSNSVKLVSTQDVVCLDLFNNNLYNKFCSLAVFVVKMKPL